MAARPTFEELLDSLETAHRLEGLRIVSNDSRKALFLQGDPDMVVPYLIEQGREALRRAAQGEVLEPVEAGQAHRQLQETRNG